MYSSGYKLRQKIKQILKYLEILINLIQDILSGLPVVLLRKKLFKK